MGALLTPKMRLQILNQQCVRSLPVNTVRQLAAELFACSLRHMPGQHWCSVTLFLVDDSGIRQIQKSVFGIDTVTDVIALRYAPLPTEEGVDGEIFVNVERAYSRPCRAPWTPEKEVALYIAHGMDHLNGSEDTTTPLRRRMRQREMRWLRRPAISALLETLRLS